MVYLIKKGTKGFVLKITRQLLLENVATIECSQSSEFEESEATFDPGTNGKDETLCGMWANAGYWGFERGEWYLLIHEDNVVQR